MLSAVEPKVSVAKHLYRFVELRLNNKKERHSELVEESRAADRRVPYEATARKAGPLAVWESWRVGRPIAAGDARFSDKLGMTGT